MDFSGVASPPCSVKSVAVVGGGVSGLAAAYKLKLNCVRVTVFEAEGRARGKLRSNSCEGLIWDEGANSLILWHIYWKNAFPLYDHGYDLVLEAIEMMEKNLPGFFYAGNHRGGLSVGKSITSGLRAADLAISYLNSNVKQDA